MVAGLAMPVSGQPRKTRTARGHPGSRGHDPARRGKAEGGAAVDHRLQLRHHRVRRHQQPRRTWPASRRALSFFNALGENLPVPVIRGIVPQDIFGVNAAAIFVDGVYVAGREGLNFSQLDVERIEVVKGPQSAMYGRNAFSGAINYVTKKPTDEFEAKVTGEYGNRGKQLIQGFGQRPGAGRQPLRAASPASTTSGTGPTTTPSRAATTSAATATAASRAACAGCPPRPSRSTPACTTPTTGSTNPPPPACPTNCEDQVEHRRWPMPRTSPIPGCRTTAARCRNWPAELSSNFPNAVPGTITDDSMPKVGEATGEERELTRGNLNVDWDAGLRHPRLPDRVFAHRTELRLGLQPELGQQPAVPLLRECPDRLCAGGLPEPAHVRADLRRASSTGSWAPTSRNSARKSGSPARRTSGCVTPRAPTTSTWNRRPIPGGLIATTRPAACRWRTSAWAPFPAARRLAIGSYIFGPSFSADGTIDPLERVISEGKTESWSIFGSVDYDLTEAWQARGEIRLAEESQESTSYTYNNLCTNPLYYQVNPNVDPVDRNDRTSLPTSGTTTSSTAIPTIRRPITPTPRLRRPTAAMTTGI